MIKELFPAEIKYHKQRLSDYSLSWLEEQFNTYLAGKNNSNGETLVISYPELTDFYFQLLESDLPVDAEIAYIAVKLGVISGNLSKVQKINWTNKAPSILMYQGLALIFMNMFKEASKLLKEAENKALNEKDDAVLFETWGIMIYLENARYAYSKGLSIYDRALEHYNLRRSDEAKEEFSSYFQWVRIAGAKSLLKTGNVRESLYLNQGALNEANKTNDKFFRSFALLGLGHALDLVGQIKESTRLYLKGLKLAKKIHANNLISIIYNRLGMASAWRLNNLDDGTEYFQRAVLYSNKGEGYWLKDGPMWNLAAAYQSKKDFTSAINTIQEIAFNARQAGESRTELIATLNLAQLLEDIGNYDEARKTRDAGESLAKILGISLKEPDGDREESFDDNPSSDDFYTDIDSEFESEDDYEEEIDEDDDFIENDEDYFPSSLEFKIDLGPDDEELGNGLED